MDTSRAALEDHSRTKCGFTDQIATRRNPGNPYVAKGTHVLRYGNSGFKTGPFGRSGTPPEPSGTIRGPKSEGARGGPEATVWYRLTHREPQGLWEVALQGQQGHGPSDGSAEARRLPLRGQEPQGGQSEGQPDSGRSRDGEALGSRATVEQLLAEFMRFSRARGRSPTDAARISEDHRRRAPAIDWSEASMERASRFAQGIDKRWMRPACVEPNPHASR